MKLLVDETLRFWIDVAADHIKSVNPNLSRRQLVAHVLREYESCGNSMRCLDKRGRIIWKASPRFLSALDDAERDARDDLADCP
jgi:hypothetical protein